MRGFLIRLGVCAASLWLASAVVPGVRISGVGTLLVAAFFLGLVNAVIRPIVIILTIPLTIVSLGAFLLVVNAAMLGLVALLLPGFAISGFFAAVFGAIVVGVTGWMMSWFVNARGRVEPIASGSSRGGGR